MRAICFLLLFIITQLTVAQESDSTKFNSELHKRIYRIGISDYQYIELIETKDHAFSGSLTNRIWRVNGKGYTSKIIIERLLIPSNDVKHIMDVADANNISTIKDGSEIEGYSNGMDGTNISFELEKINSSRNISFWEPENDYYQDPSLKEVIAIRNIISTLKEKLNFESHFDRFRGDLPVGKYAYGGVILTIR